MPTMLLLVFFYLEKNERRETTGDFYLQDQQGEAEIITSSDGRYQLNREFSFKVSNFILSETCIYSLNNLNN